MDAAPLTAEEEALREDLAEVRLDRDAVQALHSDALELLAATRAELDAAWQATGVATTVRGLTTLADVVTTLRESAAELRRERDAVVEGLTRELAMTRDELVAARIGTGLYVRALGRIEAALGLTGAPLNETVSRVLALVGSEKMEAARVDGAVAKADLLRDVARHERDVYAHVIARLRDALRLDAGASLSDVLKRAEELAARGEDAFGGTA